jgi:hypothetical protein
MMDLQGPPSVERLWQQGAMHSDGAALQQVEGGTDRALDDRLIAACATANAAEALTALTKVLRDEGLGQREMYDLFDAHRARLTDDVDETAFDGLCDAMDLICGWHAHSTEALFGTNSLPQAASRAREWGEVREERAAERDAAAASEESLAAAAAAASPGWQVLAMVAGFVLAVVCTYGLVVVAVTALASGASPATRMWLPPLALLAVTAAVAGRIASRQAHGTPGLPRESSSYAATDAASDAACETAARPKKDNVSVRRRTAAAKSTPRPATVWDILG